MKASVPQAVATVGATLGEGPAWDARRHCLWFVDIKLHQLHLFEPAHATLSSWQTPDQIGWALPAADGTLVVGIKGGLFRFDPGAPDFLPIARVEQGLPGNRLNDATTDRHGAIWFGSMDDAEAAASGRIYRYSQGAIADSGLAPVSITNGPAISPDGRTLYHTDTLGKRIYASTLGPDHVPCDTRLFAAIEEGAGYPDGPVVDSEGCLWTGLFAGWAARRYDPAGNLLSTVRFPVANVTKLAFGGNDLRTVYATTARKGLTPQQLAAQPLAGDLFSFEVDVAGLPLPLAG